MAESVFWPRLRWRLRGAWLWPAFAVLLVADTALLHLLPFAGDRIDLLGALLLSTFFNLLAVAVGAPFAAIVWRRLRGGVPQVVARDYAGAWLLALVFVAFLAGGLAHRAGRAAEQQRRGAVAAAVDRYVHASAPGYRAGLALVSIDELERDYYRACVPGRRLWLCLLVRTGQSPAGVKVDPDRTPNSPPWD